jgi:hypothetical protein
MSRRIKVVPVILKEEKEDEVDDVTPQEPQDQELRQDFHDTSFIPFTRRR